jgi:hypothetical protein
MSDMGAYTGIPPEIAERDEQQRREMYHYFCYGILLLPSVLEKIGNPSHIGNIDIANTEIIIEIIIAKCTILLHSLGFEITLQNKRILFFIILYNVKTSTHPNIREQFIDFMIHPQTRIDVIIPMFASYIKNNNFDMELLEQQFNRASADITIDTIASGLRMVFRYGFKIAKFITIGNSYNGVLDLFESLDLLDLSGGKNKKTKKRNNTKKHNKTQRSSAYKSI